MTCQVISNSLVKVNSFKPYFKEQVMTTIWMKMSCFCLFIPLNRSLMKMSDTEIEINCLRWTLLVSFFSDILDALE